MHLLLIRHCATSGQASDAPLTDEGARQAVQLAGTLRDAPIDAIVSSPYARAVASVAPLAARLGLEIGTDDRLRERVLSPEPLDDWQDHLQRSFDDPDYAVPGGESLAEAQARGLAAIAAAGAFRLPAVVSHGNLIAAVLRSVDPAFGFEAWRDLRNPDVFLVTMQAAVPVEYRRMEFPS